MAYNNQPDWETYITKPKTIKFRPKKHNVSMSQDEKDLIDFMTGNRNSNGMKQFAECL